MFTFYDLELFKYDWLIVFEQDGKITRIHNDKEALKRFLSGVHYLIGYNNYNYDDKVTAAILKGLDAYQTSQKIITNQRVSMTIKNPLTLDVMQEIRLGLSLKEAQANMKLDIVETPVDFNIDRKLNKDELERTFAYCENDVLKTKELFEKREDYFTSKFQIVKEFSLPATAVTKTRANLAAEVLKASPGTDKDRLKITYDKNLDLKQLPNEIVNFYKDIEQRYQEGEHYETLEKEKLNYKIHGVDHIFGFGGLHGAIPNYKGEGNYMQIDISSYYPSLMINNGFVTNVEEFKKIYHTRQQLKMSEDPKQLVYKILLNAAYGAMKSKYNKLFNPSQANNVVVNGQLIMAYLIDTVSPACELIQTNTDGIIIKYETVMQQSIVQVLELFEKHFNLKFDIDLINKIAQKDVNNYVIQYNDGSIKAKGRFANWEGGDFERNSLSIIDKSLVDYFIHGKRINQTVVQAWKASQLDKFQYVVKSGSFDGMVQEVQDQKLLDGSYANKFVNLQKVNRVFASKSSLDGGVYKIRNDKETKYSKVPYTSENCLVWNGELPKMDKRKIDLTWYIKEAEKYLF